MSRVLTLVAAVWLGWLSASGQPERRIVFYDEEDGLPHGHVTQLLQDEQGFMWFATWNGLCRFDGYEFCTFKSHVGDGSHMPTDRFRDIALRPDGNIICRVDDDYYLFNTRSCLFSDLTDSEARQAEADVKRYRMSQSVKDPDRGKGFSYTDRQGNGWSAIGNGISKQISQEQHTWRLPLEPASEVKCLFTDRQGRIWLTTKGDGAVRIYHGDIRRQPDYLGPDGRLHASYTRFGAAVYSMYQSKNGTLWLGAKPEGLFRLRERADNTFETDHFTDLPSTNVYSITEDHFGRLWLGTLDGGLCYTTEPESEHPRFRVPANYPKDVALRIHHLHLAQQGQLLMAAATDGLIVAQIEKDAEKMRFRRHHRESDRAESLSSSATMDILETPRSQLFIATESGGVNGIDADRLLSEQPVFRHYTARNQLLPNDVVVSLTDFGNNRLMVVGNHLVSIVDSQGVERVLDSHYFNSDYRFSEAHPLKLDHDQWLFGLMDGAFVTTTEQMSRQAYQPKVVLTGISVQGGRDNRAVTYLDTLVLQPGERNVTVRFAAIDYSAPDRINYAFRLLPRQQWSAASQAGHRSDNFIGHDRSATLLNLKPGEYLLEIRSTDADGQWLDNVRQLTIIVTPTFWESTWGHLLMVLLVVCTLGIIVYTLLYIRRIRREQHETLEKYLKLIEVRDEKQETRVKKQEVDPMLQRVMQFIEENIGNSEASVGDMAEAAATSRSGLQRKLKQAMGITPQDLLREARIKHACHLLRDTGKTVAEVAYACGFTDPKYFSRCFKQSTGQSPTDFKNML